MADSYFSPSSVTIHVGQSVTFANPSDTVYVICIGSHQSCSSSITGGPPELLGGKMVTVDPHRVQSFTFPIKGSYPITCTTHPNMDMTVTVQ